MPKRKQGRQAQIVKSTIPKQGYQSLHQPQFEVAAWCPDPDAKELPEQVHFIIHWPYELSELPPMAVRFKSPDTLGDIIEQLIEYRRFVWPDADKIEGETE